MQTNNIGKIAGQPRAPRKMNVGVLVLFEAFIAMPVEHTTGLFVREDLVGVGHLLEFLLGLAIALVLVGVVPVPKKTRKKTNKQTKRQKSRQKG
jgi:hypothetical protein